MRDNETGNVSSSESSSPVLDLNSLIAAVATQLLLGIAAIVGNSMVIYVCTRNKNKAENNMKFILHLALTDCGTGIANLVQILYIFVESLNGTLITCFLRYQMVTFFTMVSQALVSMTTCERYMAICWRPYYASYMTPRNVKIMILSSWIFGFVITALPLFDMDFVPFQTACIYHFIFPSWAFVLYASVSYVTMLISICLFAQIIRKAISFYRRIEQNRLRNENESSLRLRAMRKSIRNGKVLGIVTFVFILCWAPFNAMEIRFGLGINDDNQDVLVVFITLGLMNSVVNVFIYACQKEEFKEEFRKICKRGNSVERTQISNIPDPNNLSKGRRTAATCKGSEEQEGTRDEPRGYAYEVDDKNKEIHASEDGFPDNQAKLHIKTEQPIEKDVSAQKQKMYAREDGQKYSAQPSRKDLDVRVNSVEQFDEEEQNTKLEDRDVLREEVNDATEEENNHEEVLNIGIDQRRVSVEERKSDTFEEVNVRVEEESIGPQGRGVGTS